MLASMVDRFVVAFAALATWSIPATSAAQAAAPRGSNADPAIESRAERVAWANLAALGAGALTYGAPLAIAWPLIHDGRHDADTRDRSLGALFATTAIVSLVAMPAAHWLTARAFGGRGSYAATTLGALGGAALGSVSIYFAAVNPSWFAPVAPMVLIPALAMIGATIGNECSMGPNDARASEPRTAAQSMQPGLIATRDAMLVTLGGSL
jgi:hypothetical protein